MGPVPSQTHFLPTPSAHHQHIMTKIWTFSTEPEALHQLHILQSIQHDHSQKKQSLYCQIVCSHIERINEGQSWKVIAAFQYPKRSLRQEIILRKKKERHGPYFTEKQILEILNLAGLFIVDHYAYICSHSDVFSNIFLYNGAFKACSTEIMPLKCNNRYCSNAHLPKKIVDDILEMMLLEKVVRAAQKQKERAQYLYSHSTWLVNFIEEILKERIDILAISRRSKYLNKDTVRETRSHQYVREEEKAKTISAFQLIEAKKEKQSQESDIWEQVKQLKIPEQTKASGSIRVRHSHSFQFDSQKKQSQAPTSYFYQEKKMLLDHYHHELVESIGDHEESNSFYATNPYENLNVTQFDPVASPRMLQTNSLIILQPVVVEEPQSARVDKSFGTMVPATIIEEDNETYSLDGSKRTIESHPSQSQGEYTIIEKDGCKYQGQVLKGKKHGKGRLTYSNGVYYQGQWINDQINGYGSLFYAKGKPYYTGYWKNGNFDGKGVFYNEEQEPILGCFDYRDFSQIGKKWKSFQGTFDNDRKNGDGVLTLSNGETLRAQWKDNVIQGKGTFHNLKGQTICGIWVENVLYVEQACQVRKIEGRSLFTE